MAAYLPTLKQLQYLVALHQQGHFGRAAVACFVSQSTLSAGIRELENLLGVMLVERTRRVVRFTPLGERIAEQAHRVLREAETLADMAAGAAEPLSGELRMSVIPTIAPFMLPRLLAHLRAERPSLRLVVREETSAAACDTLHQGRADCVILALPYACGDIETALLFRDPLRVAFSNAGMAPDGPVAPPQLTPSDLLMLEDGHCLKDHALAACTRPELASGARMVGTSLHTLVQMVAGGLGTTILPQMALNAGIIDGTGIAVRPLASAMDYREIALVWRRNSARGTEMQMLADLVRAASAPV